MSRREAIEEFEQTTGARFRRIPVPRPVLAAGNKLLRRRKPAMASVMGLTLTMDDEGCEVSPEPLRRLGVEPQSASDFIATTSGGLPAADPTPEAAPHASDTGDTADRT